MPTASPFQREAFLMVSGQQTNCDFSAIFLESFTQNIWWIQKVFIPL